MKSFFTPHFVAVIEIGKNVTVRDQGSQVELFTGEFQAMLRVVKSGKTSIPARRFAAKKTKRRSGAAIR